VKNTKLKKIYYFLSSATFFLYFQLINISHLIAYPLDDWKRTNITRLEGYFMGLNTPSGKQNIVPGARLKSSQVTPRLLGENIILPYTDPDLQIELSKIVRSYGSGVSVSLFDLTDLSSPDYAEINAGRHFTPASVGKIIVALAIFESLSEIYPNDIIKREKILAKSEVIADEFILTDEHKVPFWDVLTRKVFHRPLEVGDKASLWQYLDWMLSASSNAAGSMVMKEAILLDNFKERYPVSAGEKTNFFKNNSGSTLQNRWSALVRRALNNSNLVPANLWQGGFFTKHARKIIPSSGSTSTPRELLLYLLHMEEGKLIDKFSSAEIKKLLYHTQTRIRYGSSTELDNAAIYFKSGSFFKCSNNCEKYHGNITNIMHSVLSVEEPSENRKIMYLIALSTNVLGVDSTKLHRAIASEIHQMILKRHP
jgi:hypothetical protein